MPGRRAEQDLERGRCAAARVRDGGGSALAAAFAHIEATFSPASRHAAFKDRVAGLMRCGAADPLVRARYGDLVERHRLTHLDPAILLVERMHAGEIDARAMALRAWGHCSRPRLTLMILDELRLILRMVRRYAPSRYAGLRATLLDVPADRFIAAAE
jgi:hypothetical protein